MKNNVRNGAGAPHLGEGLYELLGADVGESLELDVGQLLGEHSRRGTELRHVHLKSGTWLVSIIQCLALLALGFSSFAVFFWEEDVVKCKSNRMTKFAEVGCD